MPVPQTLTASRNATWAPTLRYRYRGPQVAPIAHIAMQLRLYGGAVGDAPLTLNPVDYVDSLESGMAGQADEVRALTLSPRIEPGDPANPAAGTWADMPAPPEAGDPVRFDFDIRITYADNATQLLATGVLILTPGVTTV